MNPDLSPSSPRPAVEPQAPASPSPRPLLPRLLGWGLVVFGIAALATMVYQEASSRARLGGQLPADPAAAARLGREVYIFEGCMHCHTQYVRPGTDDVLLWGPAADPARVLREQPPLIGNRRQGPDLMNIGNRRSPEWNRTHLADPRSLVPGSRMPSYAHLFKDARGDALVAYLQSLGSETVAARAEQIRSWKPASEARPVASATAAALYRSSCAQCHGSNGAGNGPRSGAFGGAAKCRLAPSLAPAAEMARLIKFGLPGTSMPGNETLTDGEVLGLVQYVATLDEKSR